MSAILIHPDYWRNSQLSIARFFGAIKINGTLYLCDLKTDYIIREDFVKYVRDFGVPTVEKAVKRYADECKAKEILQRLARIVKARKKTQKRQAQEAQEVVETLFAQVEEHAEKASDTVRRFVNSGYTTSKT